MKEGGGGGGGEFQYKNMEDKEKILDKKSRTFFQLLPKKQKAKTKIPRKNKHEHDIYNKTNNIPSFKKGNL